MTRPGSARAPDLPGVDRIWRQIRTGGDLLWQLLAFDYQLISTCDQVRDRIAALTPATWHDTAVSEDLAALLTEVEGIIRERQRLLAGI